MFDSLAIGVGLVAEGVGVLFTEEAGHYESIYLTIFGLISLNSSKLAKSCVNNPPNCLLCLLLRYSSHLADALVILHHIVIALLVPEL